MEDVLISDIRQMPCLVGDAACPGGSGWASGIGMTILNSAQVVGRRLEVQSAELCGVMTSPLKSPGNVASTDRLTIDLSESFVVGADIGFCNQVVGFEPPIGLAYQGSLTANIRQTTFTPPPAALE